MDFLNRDIKLISNHILPVNPYQEQYIMRMFKGQIGNRRLAKIKELIVDFNFRLLII